MKKIGIKLCLVFLSVLFALLGSAQTTINAVNQKPGKLHKVLKNRDKNSIHSLKVEGTINPKDLSYITSLPNLRSLDLSDATAVNIDSRERYITEITGFFTRWLYLEASYIHGGNLRMHLDTLALASLSELKNPAVSLFDPDFIKINSPAGLILNRCPKDMKTLDGVTDILNGAFANISTVRSITIPATVSYIPDYCFYGCKSLETVNIKGNVETIGRYAFAGTSIKSITIPAAVSYIPDYCFYGCKSLETVNIKGNVETIGECAFAGTSIKSITLPASVKTIWFNSFDGGDIKLLAQTPPEINTSEGDSYQNQSEKLRKWTVEVPQGAYYRYNGNDMWKKTTLKENGAKRKYIITMEKPGTIMSKTPTFPWIFVDTLVIKGFLYDTDMNIMKKMTSLKYVDLSDAYISESPETKAENKRHREALNAVAKLIGAAGEMAYKDGKMSTPSYLMAKSISEMESAEIKEADENCIIPAESFEGLKQLETVKMPRRAVSIGSRAFAGCTNLRNVEFPPYVKTIGSEAFCDCENLIIINLRLPKTITEIGDGAFKNCRSIY